MLLAACSVSRSGSLDRTYVDPESDGQNLSQNEIKTILGENVKGESGLINLASTF
jgi:hypothetical protein